MRNTHVPFVSSGHPPSRAAAIADLCREFGRDFVLPAVLTTAAACLLIPAPRPFAWLFLLAVTAAWGAVSRPAGVTAAASAALLYMVAHGEPRFVATVTDQWAIRYGFLLGILGAVAACGVSYYLRERSGPAPSTEESCSRTAT
jgi:hypothetical protein